MAAGKSTRPIQGATCFDGEPGRPSSIRLQDAAGNHWYFWFDTAGIMRTASPDVVELPAFNPNADGTKVGAQV